MYNVFLMYICISYVRMYFSCTCVCSIWTIHMYFSCTCPYGLYICISHVHVFVPYFLQLVELPTEWLVSLQLFGAMCVLTERIFGPSCL